MKRRKVGLKSGAQGGGNPLLITRLVEDQVTCLCPAPMKTAKVPGFSTLRNPGVLWGWSLWGQRVV